jgi:hypothetical protein
MNNKLKKKKNKPKNRESQRNPSLVAQLVPSPLTLWADATIQQILAQKTIGELLTIGKCHK